MSEAGRPQAAEPDGSVAGIGITYFTDPLCCWSWGFEPQWRRLRYAYAGRLAVRIRMGGMIPGWDRFEDPLNAIYRPAQMGPLWLQAKHVTGMPIDPSVWMHDPPASSWPACRAVKAAELQSPQAADVYLRRVREAVMLEGRNIAKREVLIAVAEDCQSELPTLFDTERFHSDLDGSEAQRSFQDDTKEARYRGIGRFPALVLHRRGAEPQILVGWRPYRTLNEAIRVLAPDIGPERRPASKEAYGTYWTRVTEREANEALVEEPQPS